jgi:hypothetical protein
MNPISPKIAFITCFHYQMKPVLLGSTKVWQPNNQNATSLISLPDLHVGSLMTPRSIHEDCNCNHWILTNKMHLHYQILIVVYNFSRHMFRSTFDHHQGVQTTFAYVHKFTVSSQIIVRCPRK